MGSVPRLTTETLATARQALGEEEFELAWAEGRSLSLEHRVAEILNERARGSG